MHFAVSREMCEAELGLLLARHLFPRNRILYSSQMEASIECGLRMFDRGESGHPANVGRKLREFLHEGNCLTKNTVNTNEVSHGNNGNNRYALRSQVFATGW